MNYHDFNILYTWKTINFNCHSTKLEILNNYQPKNKIEEEKWIKTFQKEEFKTTPHYFDELPFLINSKITVKEKKGVQNWKSKMHRGNCIHPIPPNQMDFAMHQCLCVDR